MKIRSFHFILTIVLFQFVVLAEARRGEPYLGYSDYQIITDSEFHAGKYFQQMAEYGVNFQRIWVTGYSEAAVRFDERMPFDRKRGKYQLLKIDPAYKTRLVHVMQQAEKHNQRVMLTLFDHWSLARAFGKTPWYYKNNHDGLLKNALPDFYSLKNRKLMRIQESLVREIVRSTKQFDPIYEIMNEAGSADCNMISAWHGRVASWILEESPEAEIGVNLKQECSEVLNASWVDVISFHQNIWESHGICRAIQKYPDKHVIIDTDGAWEVRDDNRLVKGWLKESLECGASFNHKDDIYDLDRELLRHYREMRSLMRGESRRTR